MSTSAEYKPRDNLVISLIQGNQFRMQLARVVTSSGSRRGSEGSMEPPFQGEPKNAFDSDRTLKAEKQAACEM